MDALAPVTLDPDELLLLRLSVGPGAERGAPFAPLGVAPAPAAIERGARSLIARGLLDRRSRRPHRELVRRLLAVAQPDLRLTLALATAPPELDLYGRASRFVAHREEAGAHVLGPVQEDVDVRDEVLPRLVARGAAGDFFATDLDLAEAALALALGREGPSPLPRLVAVAAALDVLEALVPGPAVALAPTSPGVPRASPRPALAGDALAAAGASLVARGLASSRGDTLALRPDLAPVAAALAAGRHRVLTRLDFVATGTRVEAVALVEVPGSLFALSPRATGGLALAELDARALAARVDATLRAGLQPK
jgi:hypothetical protein